MTNTLKFSMIAKALQVFIAFIFLLTIVLWTAGAIYFDIGSRLGLGWLWLALWAMFVVAILIFVKSKKVSVLIITLGFIGVFTWWSLLKPSHDRDWDPNFSQLPEFTLKGNNLTVRNVRATRYVSNNEYDCHYETRQFQLSDLQAVDLLLLYWGGSQAMSHPMVIFDFGQGRHLCFSIEVRYQTDQEYNVLRSLYRQYELIYVVCDERDAVLSRTKWSDENECYLYRYKIDDAMAETILKEFIRETNDIFQEPRWYNAVTANCTTSIYRQRDAKVTWDWRVLFNGSMDKMLYDWERLDQTLPFDDLRKRSKINEKANTASYEDFSNAIRRGLPGF